MGAEADRLHRGGGNIVSVMNRPRVLAQAVPSRQIILDLVHEPLELVPPDHQL